MIRRMKEEGGSRGQGRRERRDERRKEEEKEEGGRKRKSTSPLSFSEPLALGMSPKILPRVAPEDQALLFGVLQNPSSPPPQAPGDPLVNPPPPQPWDKEEPDTLFTAKSGQGSI